MQKIKRFLTRNLVSFLEYVGQDYLSFILRPQEASAIQRLVMKFPTIPKMAIVLQGPIVQKNDFTLETIRLYKKILPDTVIIVSTWEKEPNVLLDNIRTEGVELVLSNPPSNRGARNINLQITSAHAGIEHAKKLGCEYVAKSRTDQRLYAPNSLHFLLALLHTYPLKSKHHGQKERIMICEHETLLYRPYGATDQLMFGSINDMRIYWGAALDTRKANELGDITTIRSMAHARLCETYLATEYLKRLGKTADYTLNDSLNSIIDYFLVFDKQTVDLYWYKYEHYKERRLGGYREHTTQCMNFSSWLQMYMFGVPTISEQILDLPEKSTIPHELLGQG